MQNKATVLLVEDEENLHQTIQLNLSLEGYKVLSAFTGSQALQLIAQEKIDAIILDLMLPEIDGISIAENLRLSNNQTPILILSAKSTTNDKILGLKKGADDYLTKPFSLEELLLRVDKLVTKNAILSQIKSNSNVFSFNGNSIDFKAQSATTFLGNKIELTKKETMLLKLLIENKNEVIERDKILQLVWGFNVYTTTRTIDNFILQFRKLFENDFRNPQYFLSVRGVGYKFNFVDKSEKK